MLLCHRFPCAAQAVSDYSVLLLVTQIEIANL